jgi:hypothetical protein
MVGMRVADKDFFRAELRFVRIEPESKLRNVQVTRSKFDARKGHVENVGAHAL